MSRWQVEGGKCLFGCFRKANPPDTACSDCDEAAKHAYSDATTPGFFSPKCRKHRKADAAEAEMKRIQELQERIAELERKIVSLEDRKQLI
jgi:TolA-binding protein